jgi:Kef-type K+ transport system membrane component KefB
MTAEPAAVADSERLKKGQRWFMTGLALVMFGLIFGGGLAMVFYFLNQRPGAMICVAAGAALVGVGIVFQIAGGRMLRKKPS